MDTYNNLDESQGNYARWKKKNPPKVNPGFQWLHIQNDKILEIESWWMIDRG